MKKVLSVLLALISTMCLAFSLTACSEGEKSGEENVETGYLYPIDYAYETGMITFEQARSIIYYHNVGASVDAEIMYDNYKPLPKTPQQLTVKTEKEIKQTYVNSMLKVMVDAKLTDVSIAEYYGIYDGYVAVLISDTYNEPQHNIWVERFEDFYINNDNGSDILIWREGDDSVEVRGEFYTIEEAYDNAWLNADDLKSIACCFYESYKFDENPYTGMFDPHEELTEEMENELKQAYLEHFAEYPEGDRRLVNIFPYYGTYNGNVVAYLNSEYLCIDPKIEPEKEIGGVIFKNYWSGRFLVYHIN